MCRRVVRIFKTLRFHKVLLQKQTSRQTFWFKLFWWVHALCSEQIYFTSIRKFEAQCNFAQSLLVNDSISRQSIFPGKIPPCPDKSSTKCTSSGKSETAPQHARQPELQFKTIRKVTFYPNQHQSGCISYHKACSHVAWYCVWSWKHWCSRCSHTHTHRATKAHGCLYKPSICESVKAIVRFEDMAESNKCLAWTIMEVSPLKSCAKNRLANHNSKYSTQTKC